MYNLTWEEAQQAMREGKRVSNKNFTPEEFFEIKNGKIFCELGYPMYGWYRGEFWQDEGWSILND